MSNNIINSKALRFVAVAVIAVFLTGCDDDGPAKATISGEVKVNGQLLEKGVISFVPAEGEGVPATANIEKGQYTINTTAGKKRVQVSAPVVVDKKKESKAPNANVIEITRESLPDRYHAKTELTFDVQAGSNSKSWDLNTKRK